MNKDLNPIQGVEVLALNKMIILLFDFITNSNNWVSLLESGDDDSSPAYAPDDSLVLAWLIGEEFTLTTQWLWMIIIIVMMLLMNDDARWILAHTSFLGAAVLHILFFLCLFF